MIGSNCRLVDDDGGQERRDKCGCGQIDLLLLIPSLLDVMPPPARKKSKLVPKRHHWYGVLLFILGTLFPPLGTFMVLIIDSIDANLGRRSCCCSLWDWNRLLAQPTPDYLRLYTW